MNPAWHFGKLAFSSESSETLYLHLWSWNNRFDWWWCHWQKPDCKCMKSMHRWTLFLYSWRSDECNQVAVSRVSDASPPPLFACWGDTCSLDLYAGCSICISCVALVGIKGGDRLVLIMFSFFHPQIEKIMTLIGAGIDFSRDQQYATPGRVLTLLLCSLWMQMQWS